MTVARSHLIIAGVPKAGTTSLFEYLAQHPDVYPSRVRQTAFFKEPDGDLATYLEQFRGATDEGWLMESTPGYLARGPDVAERIRRLLPAARLVVTLRDPIDRFVSHYRMRARSGSLGPDPLTLGQFVDQVDDPSAPGGAANAFRAGQYADHLRDWRDVVGEDLRVILFDDLVRDPREVLRGLCAWLGVAPAAVDDFDLSPRNRGIRSRSQLIAALAQRASHGLRPVFQRYPRTRGLLRSAHEAVNGARPDVVPMEDAEQARAQLAARYAPTNKDLAELLREMGHEALPAWLAGSAPTAPTTRTPA